MCTNVAEINIKAPTRQEQAAEMAATGNSWPFGEGFDGVFEGFWIIFGLFSRGNVAFRGAFRLAKGPRKGLGSLKVHSELQLEVGAHRTARVMEGGTTWA